MSTAASSSTSILTTTLTESIGAFNWGPITSVFVPPTTCYQTLTSATNNGALFAGHNGGYYFDPACYPVGTVGTSALETGSSWNMYYYSPAICPSGWTTATTFSQSFLGLGPSLTQAISLGTDTSAAVCCPTGYSYVDIGHACASVALRGETISYIYPTQAGTSEALGTVTTSSVRDSTTVGCDGIPIWWQASDAAVLAAASARTGSLSSSSATNTAQSSPSSLLPASTHSSSPSPNSGSGISTGAKVAIGVCIPLAFIAILAGLIWYFRIRRNGMTGAHQGVEYAPAAGMSGKEHGNTYDYVLAQARPPAEIYADDVRQYQGYGRHELSSY